MGFWGFTNTTAICCSTTKLHILTSIIFCCISSRPSDDDGRTAFFKFPVAFANTGWAIIVSLVELKLTLTTFVLERHELEPVRCFSLQSVCRPSKWLFCEQLSLLFLKSMDTKSGDSLPKRNSVLLLREKMWSIS